MKKLKYILQHRYYIKVLALIVLLLAYTYTKVINRESVYHDETIFRGTIYKIKRSNTKTNIYIKTKEKIIIETKDISNELKLGDTIYVKGKLSIPSSNTIKNGFNYKKYLYNHNIFYIVKSVSVKKVANNTNIIYYLREKIQRRIDQIPESEYLELFILGDNTYLDNEVLSSYMANGISHLFTISGMHISIFASIILFFLKRVSYNNFYNYLVVISFLLFYSLLVGFSPSVLRSLTMYILFTINKLLNMKISKTNIMCLTLIFLLLINPFLIYYVSFEYSYIISFSLIIFNYKRKRIKNSIVKILYMSYVAFIVSIPICIYHFGKINILSIFLNVIYIPIISSLVFPLTLLSFVIPTINQLTRIIIRIVEATSLLISKYHIGIITFPKPNLIIVIIFYILIFMFLYNKKHAYIIIILFLLKLNIFFDSSYEILYLDVGQGDSILIKYPYNHGNILIDTGGMIDSNYHIVTEKTIPYFNSVGISKIKALIITHGDHDHMGEAIDLVENFKVEKVIFNCGEFNELEQELIKVLNKKKIPYYSCIKELNIDNNKLYFLQTQEYDNENDNSNVIYTKIDGYKFMFMGDAGIGKEKDILAKYNILNIDVLKVGHHGSKTSSSESFINEVNPKYSIISVGKNNRYGHPNKDVLNNLDNSKIYRTDEDGSIMFKIKNNKLQIETCTP